MAAGMAVVLHYYRGSRLLLSCAQRDDLLNAQGADDDGRHDHLALLDDLLELVGVEPELAGSGRLVVVHWDAQVGARGAVLAHHRHKPVLLIDVHDLELVAGDLWAFNLWRKEERRRSVEWLRQRLRPRRGGDRANERARQTHAVLGLLHALVHAARKHVDALHVNDSGTVLAVLDLADFLDPVGWGRRERLVVRSHRSGSLQHRGHGRRATHLHGLFEMTT
mmetsp:Transcript_20018/g.70793  ORF Transcript_20018/g.70793 Transcript_20018/m.70793 type:complete len:222 (-) Transcript_20018:200-865(-)